MKAILEFPSRDMALELATQWSRFTKRGHTLSATKQDGKCEVTLDGVNPDEKDWINARVAEMNARKEPA